MSSRVVADNVQDIPFIGAHLGACVGHENPDLWHAEGAGNLRIKERREAREICFSCHVREACFNYAIQYYDCTGIWGGATVYERRNHVEKNKIKQVSMLYKQNVGLIW